MALIEVEPGEYKRGGQGDVLVSRDIYSCLVVAARIRLGKAGYLGHFATVEIDPNELIGRVDEVTDAATREAGNKKHVSLWLTGCAPMDIEFPEIRASRELVGDHLAADGFARVRELWLPTDEYAINQARLEIADAHFRAPFVHSSNWPG